jgi:hypothetical protein
MAGKLPRRVAIVEMSDGTLFEDVRITAADTVQYEITAAAHKWPTITVRGQTGTVAGQKLKECFEVWHALTRRGDYEGIFEDFWGRDVADFEIDDGEPVDPTVPAIAAG